MALHNLACAYWWDYCNLIDAEREKAMKEPEKEADAIAQPINEEFQSVLSQIESKNKLILPNLKQAIKSFER